MCTLTQSILTTCIMQRQCVGLGAYLRPQAMTRVKNQTPDLLTFGPSSTWWPDMCIYVTFVRYLYKWTVYSPTCLSAINSSIFLVLRCYNVVIAYKKHTFWFTIRLYFFGSWIYVLNPGTEAQTLTVATSNMCACTLWLHTVYLKPLQFCTLYYINSDA